MERDNALTEIAWLTTTHGRMTVAELLKKLTLALHSSKEPSMLQSCLIRLFQGIFTPVKCAYF